MFIGCQVHKLKVLVNFQIDLNFGLDSAWLNPQTEHRYIVMSKGYPRLNFSIPAPLPAHTLTHTQGTRGYPNPCGFGYTGQHFK